MSIHRPFIRIAATYPITRDDRLPSAIEVELDVDDVSPEENPGPPDGEEFPSGGFTRFVCQVVETLGGVATAKPTTVNVFGMKATPEVMAQLGDLLGHAADCDGTCDQPAADQPAEPPSPPARMQSERDTVSAYPSAAGEKGGA